MTNAEQLVNYAVTWETDGEDVTLPSVVSVPVRIAEDMVCDWLSDEFGWLVSDLVRVD